MSQINQSHRIRRKTKIFWYRKTIMYNSRLFLKKIWNNRTKGLKKKKLYKLRIILTHRLFQAPIIVYQQIFNLQNAKLKQLKSKTFFFSHEFRAKTHKTAISITSINVTALENQLREEKVAREHLESEIAKMRKVNEEIAAKIGISTFKIRSNSQIKPNSRNWK